MLGDPLATALRAPARTCAHLRLATISRVTTEPDGTRVWVTVATSAGYEFGPCLTLAPPDGGWVAGQRVLAAPLHGRVDELVILGLVT